ncbi:MAG TPA: class I SAM-dependent methyltransferase [Anaeromyxobacteraceae bacterium]|nr:class I SAM-dependent methyltransferase [Anaeromyxobacteraceae bacterium]
MTRDTRDAEYTARLARAQSAPWKRLLGVQLPYRWNLRRLRLGRTLEVGCGIGRNLVALSGAGVGIDHNAHSVAYAREHGLEAFTPEGFLASRFAVPASFDSLLLSHVIEHMTGAEAAALVREHAPWLRPGGRLVVITPQDAGFASDASHVQFMDFEAIRAVMAAAGFAPDRAYSFPFPRPVGRFFTYNEFVVLGRQV